MDASCMYINYIAEQTLRRHYGTTTREDRPLVAGTDGKTNLLNPTNKYTSCFPNDFNGCLGCGSPDHCFRSCPRKDGKILKDDFSTRKKPIPPCVSSNPFIHPSIPPTPSSSSSNLSYFMKHWSYYKFQRQLYYLATIQPF